MSETDKPLAAWLFICAAAVFVMALVGAVTRLTESGLSIVQWEPIAGILPPLSDESWENAFSLYKQSPQYTKVNHGMELAEFKGIYFWEWMHRFWGRMIGVIYFVPLFYFAMRRRLPQETMPAFIGILALGVLQGGMGWFMVKSGLVDEPAVSHYRLAAHLMLAALIFTGLFRMGLFFGLAPEPEALRAALLRGRVRDCFVLVFLTMTWGAFTAGLDAGQLYNTFPKMDDYWIPPELLQHRPLWLAFIKEPATVQWVHRILAVLTLLSILALVQKSFVMHPPRRLTVLFVFLGLMVFVQVGLGIATLLTQVNITLATLHQAGAFLVLALLTWLWHEIPRAPDR